MQQTRDHFFHVYHYMYALNLWGILQLVRICDSLREEVKQLNDAAGGAVRNIENQLEQVLCLLHPGVVVKYG